MNLFARDIVELQRKTTEQAENPRQRLAEAAGE
jgi:hypothetical protein